MNIGLICKNYKGITYLDLGVYVAESWKLNEGKVAKCKEVTFHETHHSPSYLRGEILHTYTDNGRVCIVFKECPKCDIYVTGWSQEKRYYQ